METKFARKTMEIPLDFHAIYRLLVGKIVQNRA